jgi:hypothetical protein
MEYLNTFQYYGELVKNDEYIYKRGAANVLFIGGWSLYLAVRLEQALKTIEKQKREIAQMVLPPF